MSVNKVVLLGRLGKDVELRTTPKGTAVCEFSLAVDRKLPDSEEKKTSWIPVTVWSKGAEIAAAQGKKGALVLVEGRLEEDKWEKDGQKRSKLKVVADFCHWLQYAPRVEGDISAAPAAKKEASDDDIPF